MRFCLTYSPILRSIFLAVSALAATSLGAQGTQVQPDLGILQSGKMSRAEVTNGDTVPVVNLSTVDVYTTFIFKTRRQCEHWTRTKYNVKVVYPYAILAAA